MEQQLSSTNLSDTCPPRALKHDQVMMDSSPRLNLDAPRFDQTTFIGRVYYFFAITNPHHVFHSSDELERAKSLVDQYRLGLEPEGTLAQEVWRAKDLVDSAYHPDTGELNVLPGRMSFQVPGKMFILGCMMSFYKRTSAVVFWQFINQSFNCVVNHTNRNASTNITNNQLLQAYAGATTASVITALSLNHWIASASASCTKQPRGGPLLSRLVPFFAVAVANCVNIPLTRQRELLDGIEVRGTIMSSRTSNSRPEPVAVVVEKSQVAAQIALSQVVPSRILMTAPGMVLPSIVMNHLETHVPKLFTTSPKIKPLVMMLLTGSCLAISTPVCCALFPQQVKLAVDRLEPQVRDRFRKHHIQHVVYNKGL